MLGKIRALFSEVHALAKDDRRLSQGKMGADDAKALRDVVDAMDVQPEAPPGCTPVRRRHLEHIGRLQHLRQRPASWW